MPLVDYLINPGEMASPEAIDRKRKMAQMLAMKGSDTSPVGHWSQGAARIVDALSGGLEDWQARSLEKNSNAAVSKAMEGIFGGGGGGGSAPPMPAAGGAPAASGGPANLNSFDGIVNRVLQHEGGYTVDNGGPTNYGISSRANPDVDVKNLTPDAAKGIYKSRYWDAIGGDQLLQQNPALAYVAFDTAVNAGPGTAKGMLERSGGDPAKFLALRQHYNDGLVARDPQQYQRYQNGWNNRLAAIGSDIGGGQQQPTQVAQADVPAPGAQPAQYQVPGQPQQAPQQPQQGGMTRVQAIMQLSKAWPYMKEAQRQQAQMYINAMPQAKDPTQAALDQENLLKAQHERGQWGAQDQKLQNDLAGGAPVDVQLKNASIAKTLAETGQIGLTGDQKDYDRAKGEGFKGNFMDFQKVMKEASRSQVNIDQRAENAEETGRGTGLSKRLNDVADEGGKAQEDALMFQRFGQLLGNVQTGGKTALLEGIRQLTNGTVTLDPNVDNVQALNAAVQYLAPRLRVPGTGTQSDAELRNFMNSVPTLAGQPGGNKIILDSLQGLVQYKLQRAEIAQAWQSGDLTGKEATKRIQSLAWTFANLPKVEEPKGDQNKRLPTPVDGWQDVGGGFKIRQK